MMTSRASSSSSLLDLARNNWCHRTWKSAGTKRHPCLPPLLIRKCKSSAHIFDAHFCWKVLCFKAMRYWHDWFPPILYMSSAELGSEKPSHRGELSNWIWVKFWICSTSCAGTLSNTTMDSRSCDPWLVGFDSVYNVVMLHCRLALLSQCTCRFWLQGQVQCCRLALSSLCTLSTVSIVCGERKSEAQGATPSQLVGTHKQHVS